MIETTYTCDRCGHKQNTPDQMWRVAIATGCWGPYVQSLSPRKESEQMWCRGCMKHWHLLPQTETTKDIGRLPEPPTLEDLVREIVREEIRDGN